jgi:ribonuclease H / adenosylcobalamin/alpha-ribazole phosphatase
MDSKLVVEQMSGRWKIKHPDMRPLAIRANSLAPFGTLYTWVPREENKRADKILNDALDGKTVVTEEAPAEEDSDPVSSAPRPPSEQGPPTTFVLVRHGETDHTRDRKFSGSGGADPGLNDDGREQVRSTAEWLAGISGSLDALVTSPLRRTRETAEILGDLLGLDPVVEDGMAEASFGAWDGLTFADARAKDPAEFDRWISSTSVKAGGTGESVEDVERRVRRARDRLITKYPGQTVLVTSHVTPIKMMVKLALDMPLSSLFRTELAPASVTVVAWYPGGNPVLRLFNGRPTEVLGSPRAF